MSLIEILLWASIFIVFYAYLGYGVVLWLLLKVRSLFAKHVENQPDTKSFLPITLIIPVYNEEKFIRKKIQNTLALDYPEEKLHVIFITDGSTDKTPEIISEYPQLTLMHREERKGKIAAMNRVMEVVNTPYVVFCDANTLLNPSSIQEIAKHYLDPKVGGVAGEKKVISLGSPNMAGEGEGLYWKYESFLKKLDADFYTIVGAAGELFSFKTELFEPVEEDILLDDFIISLRICQKGYRVVYEPKAYAMESPSANLEEEQKRKIRISAGGFQSIIRLKALLNIFKYPKLSFQYISHRVLRWAVCPFLLPLILLLNVLIVVNGGELWYRLLLFCQLGFYFMALIGTLLTKANRRAGPFNLPYYFLFMNISLYYGLLRFLKGNQTVLWEKAKRTD